MKKNINHLLKAIDFSNRIGMEGLFHYLYYICENYNTMKTFNYVLILAIIFIFFSCDNEETPRPGGGESELSTISTVEKFAVQEDQLNKSLNSYVVEALTSEPDSLACMQSTVSPTDSTYEIVINFATDGCYDQWGNFHQGSIKAIYMPNSPSNFTLVKNFENYSFNNVSVVGSTESIFSMNEENQRVIEREAQLTLTPEQGLSNDRTSSYIATKIAGNEDEDESNDVFSVIGSSTNTLSNGEVWSVNNLSAVVRPYSCEYYAVSGLKNGVNYQTNQSYLIDFGDGTCDGTAQVTLPSGQEVDLIQF